MRTRLCCSILTASLLLGWLARDAASADAVILADDSQALAARFQLVRHAQHRVQLAYFIASRDTLTHAFAAELRDAALRGVRVQLVVDAYGDHLTSAVKQRLARAGVEIRQYHPLHWVSKLPQRLHDKLLVADQAMILGGRNLGNKYFGLLDGENFRDLDLLVTGAEVAAASAYFDQLWTSRKVRPPAGLAHNSAAHARRLLRLSSAGDRRLDAEWNRDRESLKLDSPGSVRAVRQMSADTVQGCSVRFVGSRRIDEQASQDITDVLIELLATARQRIVVATPYLILSDRFSAVLKSAIERGVRVVMITNSLGTTNHPLVHAGYLNQRQAMLEMGIELWEYHGPGQYHAKSLLVDDTAVLGSYNLNPRSEFLDTEIATVIEDKRLSVRLERVLVDHLQDSVRIGATPAKTPAERPASAGRRATLPILRLAAPLVERHL